MALKLRRGSDLQRLTITPQEGELLYTTDTKKLYVGDGSTTGGNQVSPIYTKDLIEDTSLFYTTERAQDDAAVMFTTSTTVATTHSGISFAYNDASGKIVATVPDKGTVLSAQAGEIATYNTTGTTISGTTGLLWDNNIRQMGLSNSSIQVTASTGNRSLISFETSAPGAIGNNVSFSRSRGTLVTPTVLQTFDTMGGIVFNGYDGSDYITGASLFAYVPTGYSISTGVMPTAMNLNLTDGAGVNATRFRVLPNGTTVVGPFSQTETGTGYLNINTTVAAGSGITNPTIGVKTFFDTSAGQKFTMTRYRGTFANPTAAQNGDEIFNFTFLGFDGANVWGAAKITGLIDGPVTTGKTPGAIRFSTSNNNGVSTNWTKLDKDGILSHTGGFKHTGVKYVSPIYNTISASGTVDLSATTSDNVLLVGNTGYTITLNMPATPADGQVCEFIVHSNATTLALGTGTVTPSFAGAVSAGAAFKYVYRASNTTWYKLG